MRTARVKFERDITPVESTLVRVINYDPNTRTLDLTLTSDSRYRYRNVPETVFATFVTRASTGKAYNEMIKGKFQSRKLPKRKVV